MLALRKNRPDCSRTVLVTTRTLIALALLSGMTCSDVRAQTDAAWLGTAGDGSYNNAANWDGGVVPVNDAVPTTYNVTIPGGVGVTFDVDGVSDVTDLTLGVGATLTIGPGKQLNVLDDALISGTITTTAGTLIASGVAAQFPTTSNNVPRLLVSGTGQIAISAAAYAGTRSDYRANLTLMSSLGAGSQIDLSSLQSFSSQSWGHSGSWRYSVVASDHGTIDLSSLGTIAGSTTGNDDWLEFKVETDGTIPLTSLTQVSGRTLFSIDVDNYGFPALVTAASTHFAAGVGRAVVVPELISMPGIASGISVADGGSFTAAKLTAISGSGGSLTVGDQATLVAIELLSIDGKSLSIAAGGTISAPKLVALTNSTLTLRPLQTFTHGVITDVNFSELHVRDGATLNLSGVNAYANVLSDFRANFTFLSAQGQGSLLDLSSLQSFDAMGSWGHGGSWLYDVKASDHAVIDLSSVGTISGANTGHDDWLRFRIETEGSIPLTSLTQTSGRTLFSIDVDNHSFPALVTATNTHFAVSAGRAVVAPELTTMPGTSGGVGVSDAASFTAMKLTTISGAGGSLIVGDGATLDAPELLSIDGKSLSIAAGGTIIAPKLVALTNSTLTLRPLQTFQHDVITDVNYSELHVRDGATLTLDGVGQYTNLVADSPRASVVFLSARGLASSLDLSSLQSFSAAGSWAHGGSHRYDVAVSDRGVIDLSSVSTIIGAATHNDDWLRFKVETEGNIPLTSLTQVSDRTEFDVDVDNYSFPVLETAANTRFVIHDARAVSAPMLRVISGGGGSIDVGNGATFDVPELISIDSESISIAAGGTISAPKLVSLTNSTLTLRPTQTFTHGVIADVDYSELHVRDGAALDLSGVVTYANVLNDFRGNFTFLSAQGLDSSLDLSSVKSIDARGSWGHNGGWRYDVAASDRAVIDLSSVGTINGAGQDDWLRFKVDTGGTIDLSSVRSMTARVEFVVNGDGVLKLGDVALTQTTYFNVNSPETDVNVAGSLYLDGASRLSMATGSELKIQGALYHAYTDEAKLGTDSAIVHFNGTGIQFIEAGGEDLGPTGSASGNFGFGRLVVGEMGQPTTVLPLDLYDNGNRTGGAHEALYLYGVGGLDGLELIDGSTLVLDGINVYAMEDGSWVHLNALVGEGEAEAAYSGGTIRVPEPSGLILLAVAALAMLLLRRLRIASR